MPNFGLFRSAIYMLVGMIIGLFLLIALAVTYAGK